ncbi:MAG: cell surface protein, partial [Parcubacteria group bacterium Gr01-1014_29]
MVAGMLLTSLPAPAFAVIYQPGETLNPGCAPTDQNCNVVTPVSVATSTPGLAAGSLIYLQAVTASSTSWLAIPIGTNNQMLTINASGTPAWSTFSVATTTINSVSGPAFTFNVGTTGTDFAIATSSSGLTFNLPNASATARGLVSTGTQTFAGDKTFSGSLTAATSTLASLSVTGNTTLGDASSDALTINGTAVSIPNNLNFDSNTLYIDAVNDRIGIGTSTPSAKLAVSGGFSVFGQVQTGTQTNPGLVSTGGTVLGTAVGGTDTVIQYNGSGT